MVNILSYQSPAMFSGGEIKAWIDYNIKNQSSKADIAKRLKKKYPKLDDNKLYEIMHSENENERDPKIFLVDPNTGKLKRP